LVIGSPAYHGGVSGLVKNAIDLLEDLREDTNSYFSGRAVGLVVTAAGWQACGVTLQALRGIVHALRGWPTPLGIAVNSLDQKPFDPDGRLIDPNIKAAIKLQAEQVMVFASK
jgi:FMN reductase